MIYLFGNKNEQVQSIVYDGSNLTEEDKKGSILVSKLPTEQKKEGYAGILFFDNDYRPYWKYVPIPKPSLEEKVIYGFITKEEYKILTGKDFTV
jgi:hypothetical protein